MVADPEKIGTGVESGLTGWAKLTQPQIDGAIRLAYLLVGAGVVVWLGHQWVQIAHDQIVNKAAEIKAVEALAVTNASIADAILDSSRVREETAEADLAQVETLIGRVSANSELLKSMTEVCRTIAEEIRTWRRLKSLPIDDRSAIPCMETGEVGA